MLLASELEDCLVELPAFNPWDLWRNRRVSDAENPVRDVEAIESVRESALALSPPVARIYRVRYLDGSQRELVNGHDDPADFSETKFLNPGRTGNTFREVWALVTDEPVPLSLRELLVDYEQGRNQAAAARKLQHG